MNLAFIRICSALLITGATSVAHANGGAYVSGEFWGPDDPGGHGIVIVAHAFEFDAGKLLLEWNTDTLTARWQAPMGPFTWGVQARGEAVIAGLLQDYYVGGARIDDLGFDASYLDLSADLKYSHGAHHVHTVFGARHWEFGDAERPNYVTPPAFNELRQELGYTYWGVESDASWTDPHRQAFRRVTGFASGIRLLTSYRDDASDWGFGVRNTPATFIPRLRQWAQAGVQIARPWRLQLRQDAGWGWDEDDITRERVGGMNAYVVPIAGAPWAAWLVSRYVTGRVSQHVRLFGETELVVAIDAGYLNDRERTGADRFGTVVGTALGLDARFGQWQLDLIAGYAPDTGWQRLDGPLLSAYLGVGRGW